MATSRDQPREHARLSPPPPGFYGDPEDGVDTQFSFSEKTIRLAFIRKVYGILTVQLLITFGFVTLFVFSEDVKGWVQTNVGFLYGAIAVSFATLIAMACCPGVRRKFPGNMICLVVFTLAEGYLVGAISSFYDTYSVIMAVGATVILCSALTIFAFQTKWDFTAMGAGLFIVLFVFVLFGFLMIFLPRDKFPILHLVYAGLGCLIFSIYLVYDTQLMMGGKHKYALSPEEYIFAALNLYLDIINIFLYILAIFGDK